MGLQLLENEQIGSLNNEQKNLVNGIREDSSRLLKITGELLNITQVESGSIQLNMKESSINKIVEYAVEANKSSAEQKHIHFKIDVEKGLLTVLADNEKTAWVLNNLLSNAIRYSYENSNIKITVRKVEDKIQFSVTDTGQELRLNIYPKSLTAISEFPEVKKKEQVWD
jgi:signal transduction histidine kinase